MAYVTYKHVHLYPAWMHGGYMRKINITPDHLKAEGVDIVTNKVFDPIWIVDGLSVLSGTGKVYTSDEIRIAMSKGNPIA